MVPDDIGAPVTVHVAHPDDSERRADERRLPVLAEHGRPADQLLLVHEPDLGLPGLVVIQEDRGGCVCRADRPVSRAIISVGWFHLEIQGSGEGPAIATQHAVHCEVYDYMNRADRAVGVKLEPTCQLECRAIVRVHYRLCP